MYSKMYNNNLCILILLYNKKQRIQCKYIHYINQLGME